MCFDHVLLQSLTHPSDDTEWGCGLRGIGFFFFFNITELVRMDIKLQWVASDNVDFYTFLARNLVLKSGNWRRCRIWDSPPTNVTHSWPYFLL